MDIYKKWKLFEQIWDVMGLKKEIMWWTTVMQQGPRKGGAHSKVGSQIRDSTAQNWIVGRGSDLVQTLLESPRVYPLEWE